MRIILFAFHFCLVLFSCAPEEKTKKTLDAILNEYFSKQFSPNEPGGAVILLIGDSVVFSEGYGLANLQTKEGISSKTLFNIGSISKTFVANGILILQAQGKLSIEDSLHQYFRDFKNTDIAKRVKIKHLLSHTSGLPDLRNVSDDSVFYLTAKDAENWYPVTQTEKLEFEPGSEFSYSNPAYNGLALVIEKVSGMKWQHFIEKNIFEPAGMVNSTITDGPHPQTGVSHGYVKNHGE